MARGVDKEICAKLWTGVKNLRIDPIPGGGSLLPLTTAIVAFV
jgi:hypothetical protein